MAWDSSDRRTRLPSDWPRIRKRILKRDRHQCQAKLDSGKPCREFADEVDHIRAGDNHADWNLQALCNWHHKEKSSSEGGKAYWANRKKVSKRFRKTETHPGLL